MGYLRITKRLDKANTIPTMDLSTMAAGSTVNKREKERKSSEMVKRTMECGARAKRTVLVSFSLKMEVTTKENS